MEILLIEDQRKMAENMKQYLELQSFKVQMVHDGLMGLDAARDAKFDAIILDINLPGLDGFTICARLRNEGITTPILMLTARDTQREVVHGLNIGADDYLTKPFDLEELTARIHALLRRTGSPKSPVFHMDDITVDTNLREVKKSDKRVDLSPKEYALFEFLLKNRGTVQDRPTIIEHVWGGNDALMFSQTVDVHVAYIRRKLGKQVIHTVPGKGYVIP